MVFLTGGNMASGRHQKPTREALPPVRAQRYSLYTPLNGNPLRVLDMIMLGYQR